MDKKTIKRVSPLPLEVIYISDLFEEWKDLKEFHNDPAPPDEDAAKIVFYREVMQCTTVPVTVRVKARTWLEKQKALPEAYPITVEEFLKERHAKPIFGFMRSEVRNYKLIVLIVDGDDTRFVEAVYEKLIDLFVGFISVGSSYANKTLVITGSGCAIKVVHIEENWFPAEHYAGQDIGYRVVENIHDV